MTDVSQGKYIIIPKSHGDLNTSGLATCSAIGFIVNDSHKFMAHIDAKTNVDAIAKKISSQFGTPLHISDVKIWYGDGISHYTSEYTQKLIKRFTQILGIQIEPLTENDDDVIQHLDKDIVECRKCRAKSGTLKIIPHYYQCPYVNKVEIRTVGFMETVSF